MNRVFQKILSNSGFLKYLKNTSWLLLEKILRIAVGLFIGVWMARYLGPEEFGIFSYTLSFVGMFAVFANLGMDSVLVKELVDHKLKVNKLLGTAFYLRLVSSACVMLAIFFASTLLSNDNYENTLIFIISGSVIFQSFNVIDLYFQSRVMGKQTTYMNSVALFLSSLIKIYLLISEAPLIHFAYLVLFDAFVLAVGYVYIYIKFSTTSIFKIYFDKNTALTMMKNTWPILISTVFVTIYMKIDQVMIMNMLGSEHVGQYAVAVKLSEAWYFIPGVVAMSLFPAIINAKKISKSVYDYRLRKLYDLMIYMSVIVAILTTLVGKDVIDFLYGYQYQKAGSVLIIHIWAGIFVFLGNVSNRWMIIENLQIYIAIYSAIGAIINIVLNYLLLPIMGIDGAALATLISYFISTYLCLFLSKKTRKGFIQLSQSLLFKRAANNIKN